MGFVARHAMVTKVRGAFDDVAGTIVIDAANPSGSTASVAVAAGLGEHRIPRPRRAPARRRLLRRRGQQGDDVRHHRASSRTATTFVLLGDLTIKGVTRPVEIEFEPTGVATDPFGNVRAGFEGEAEISRKDFGLVWNVALEAGGVLVSDKIKIQLDVSAIKTA